MPPWCCSKVVIRMHVMLLRLLSHRISPHVGLCQRRGKQAEVTADLYVAQLRITLVYQLWWHLLAISVIPDKEQYHRKNVWFWCSYTISVGWLSISELHSDLLLCIWMRQPLGSLNKTAASWIKRQSMEMISTRLVIPLAWFASLLRSRLRANILHWVPCNVQWMLGSRCHRWELPMFS